MSVSTFKSDAWICVFERLPPPHPDEVKLVRGLGREAYVAVCVTVEREIRRIAFLDQTINVPHAQVLLSELEPENREIVFVDPPTVLKLLLVQWELVTKVKRVVHDTVVPFVPGSYIPVTDYGREALAELVSRPTLPKGFVAAVRRRVAERWRSVQSPTIPVPNDIRPFLCEFGLWQTVHHPSGSFTQRITPRVVRPQLPAATSTPAVFPSAAVPSAATAVFPNNRTDQNPATLTNPASVNSSNPPSRTEQCFGVRSAQVPNIFGARSSPARPVPHVSAAIVPTAGYFVISGPTKTGQRSQPKSKPVAQSRGPLQAPQGRRAAEAWTTKPKQVMDLGKAKPKFQAQRITPPDAASSSTQKSGTKNSRKRLVKQQPREENKAERRPKPRDSSDARRGPKGSNSTRESASPVVKEQPVATRTDDEPSKENTKEQEYLAYKRLRNKFRRKRRGGRQQSARSGTAAAHAASAPRMSEDRVDEGGAVTSGLPPVADIAMELCDAPAAPEPVASLPVVSTHTEDSAPATAESSPAVGLPEKMVCDDDGVLDGASEGPSLDSEEEEKILAGEENRARRVIDTRGEIMKVTIACAVANKKLQQRQAEGRTLSIFGEELALAQPPLVTAGAMAPPPEILLPGVESVSGTQSVPDPLNQSAPTQPAAPRSGDPLTTASSAPVPVESDRGYSVPSAENIALTQVTSTIAEMKVDEQAAAPGTSKAHQVDEVVVAAPSAAEPLQLPATAVDPPAEPPVYGSRDYRETNKDETEAERLAKIKQYKDDYYLKHGYPKGKGRAGGKKSSKNHPKQMTKKSEKKQQQSLVFTNTKSHPTMSQPLNSRIRVTRRNQDQSQQSSASVQDEQHPPPSAGPEAAAPPIQRDAEIPTGPGAAGHQSGGPDPERLSLRTPPAQVDAPPTAATIPTSVSSAGAASSEEAGNFDAFFAPPKPSA